MQVGMYTGKKIQDIKKLIQTEMIQRVRLLSTRLEN